MSSFTPLRLTVLAVCFLLASCKSFPFLEQGDRDADRVEARGDEPFEQPSKRKEAITPPFYLPEIGFP